MSLSFDTITTREDLRALMGEPVHPAVVAKTLRALDSHCRVFIARSPFMLISSADAQGRMDISPRGDPAGFVRVLDDTTLAIPDRPGNQRFDTLENLIDNPRVGLIFLIPGKRETLRVSGTARIVAEPALRETMAIKGKSPALAIVVDVEEAFFHCAKCMVRSAMWEPDKWPSLTGLPTLAQAMSGATDIPVEALHEAIAADETGRLY